MSTGSSTKGINKGINLLSLGSRIFGDAAIYTPQGVGEISETCVLISDEAAYKPPIEQLNASEKQLLKFLIGMRATSLFSYRIHLDHQGKPLEKKLAQWYEEEIYNAAKELASERGVRFE